MKVSIKKIEGNWDAGYALDKHMLKSVFIGHNEYGHAQFDNTRTEVGEAVYQLKYRQDWAQVEPLARQIADSIVPLLGQIGVVIPVPASKVRARQPVYEVATSLAKRIGVESFEGVVIKTAADASSTPLKDLATKQEKMESLKGRFEIKDAIPSQGPWNALVVDDLYDTGASMEAVCSALRTYRKIKGIYVAALTWK